MRIYRFGETVPSNGRYCVVDKNGNEYVGMLIDLIEGDTFPITTNDEHGYIKK